MRFLHKTEPANAEQYLADLRRAANRALPAEKAEQVVAEVAQHVQEQTNALVVQGETQADAETKALQPFGRVGQFVRAVAWAQHQTRFTMYVRNITFAVSSLGASGYIALFLWTVTFPSAKLPIFQSSLFWLIFFCLVPTLALIGAMLARRAQTVRYLLTSFVAAACIYGYVGRNIAEVGPTYMGERGTGVLVIFRGEIPARIRQNNDTLRLWTQELRQLPKLEANPTEARRSQLRVLEIRRAVSITTLENTRLEYIARTPVYDHLRAVIFAGFALLFYSVVLLPADILGAWLGRVLYRYVPRRGRPRRNVA